VKRTPVYDVGLEFLLRDLRHMQAAAARDLEDWLIYLDLEETRPHPVRYHREIARLLRAYPEHELGDFTDDDLNAVLRTVPPRSGTSAAASTRSSSSGRC
jgi:hypothetical protein